MAALTKHARSTNGPSPIYGIRPGFTIADLEGRYMNPIRVYGTWDSTDKLTSQTNTPDSGSSPIKTHARVIKLTLNVSGTGTVHIIGTTTADSSTIFDPGFLPAGSYEFFVGGWASVDSDNSSYQATQYGPSQTPSDFDADNPTGNMDVDDPSLSAGSNYFGGTYNPFQFLSLDGYDVQFTSDSSGSVAWDLTVVAVS